MMHFQNSTFQLGVAVAIVADAAVSVHIVAVAAVGGNFPSVGWKSDLFLSLSLSLPSPTVT